MKFVVEPEVFSFYDLEEFDENFVVAEGCLVFTDKTIYELFLKDRYPKAHFLFQDDFGTGEPDIEMIDSILVEASKLRFKRIFAFGGGTVLDIAKLIALRNNGDCLELFERRIGIEKVKKLIAIPTTCGTGSEVTNIAIAGIKEQQTKMGLAADALYPDSAVLVSQLVREIPYGVFATSSIDALIHAVEAFLSPKSNQYSDLFAVNAIRLLVRGFVQLAIYGKEYREKIIDDFLVGSNQAGIAFGNAGVGAVHALSYPMGGVHHVAHGEANSLFFVDVLTKYYEKNPDGKILALNVLLAELLGIEVYSETFAELDVLLTKILERKPLRSYGMTEEQIELFADSVIEKQQRLLANNYVELSRDEIRDIYKRLF